MALTGEYVEANGLRVYHEIFGEGGPLLLVHGGTATSRSWASHLPSPGTSGAWPPGADGSPALDACFLGTGRGEFEKKDASKGTEQDETNGRIVRR